ncbi:hypothetical protein [Mesorhizobium sp.]|uniref:hypothetical protein n=1 Tax=Mesorhizobium sp. TaxID=1871066 RepID=UPI00267CE4AF
MVIADPRTLTAAKIVRGLLALYRVLVREIRVVDDGGAEAGLRRDGGGKDAMPRPNRHHPRRARAVVFAKIRQRLVDGHSMVLARGSIKCLKFWYAQGGSNPVTA